MLKSLLGILCVVSAQTDMFAQNENHTVQQRPNIIFLLADDLAPNAVGYRGNQDVITPNIDALAHEGVSFIRHYNTSPICMPSRATIMTGLYEYRHGCSFEFNDMDRRFMAQSYPVLLRKAGYFTGIVGKTHLVFQDEKFDAMKPLFDEWGAVPGQMNYATKKNVSIAKYAGKYPHNSRACAAWAQDFLKLAKKSGKPFCLSVGFKAPHDPYQPDPIDLKLYRKKTFTRPSNFGVENGRHLSPQVHTSRAATSYREWVRDFDRTVVKYYALVTGLDAAVGMIRDELKRQGLDKNTIIIFTSDNGYNCASHGFADKVLPYEEASNAPLIIYDPRLPEKYAGATCEALTANVDISPTLCALAGVPAPADLDGRNLSPLLTNSKASVREVLPIFNFWGIRSAQYMAVLTPEWKYIYWYYSANGVKPVEELFRISQDRTEMHLVSDKQQLEVMRAYYDAELENIEKRAATGHKRYAAIFSRTMPWKKKAALIIPSTVYPLRPMKMPSQRDPKGK